MSDMPKTTFFLTAMVLLGLYLWRTHRTPHGEPAINAGGALEPGTGTQTPGTQTAAIFASQRVGGYNALAF